MTKPPKSGHLSYVPLQGHTKEWFKKDVQTIKKSAKTTARRIPLIILIEIILISSLSLLAGPTFNLLAVLIYSIALSPVVVLGYFLLHVLKTKGYDVRAPGSF